MPVCLVPRFGILKHHFQNIIPAAIREESFEWMEIDFLIVRDVLKAKICPIVAKSAKRHTLSSFMPQLHRLASPAVERHRIKPSLRARRSNPVVHGLPQAPRSQ
jgi:hypothetical protein